MDPPNDALHTAWDSTITSDNFEQVLAACQTKLTSLEVDAQWLKEEVKQLEYRINSLHMYQEVLRVCKRIQKVLQNFSAYLPEPVWNHSTPVGQQLIVRHIDLAFICLKNFLLAQQLVHKCAELMGPIKDACPADAQGRILGDLHKQLQKTWQEYKATVTNFPANSSNRGRTGEACKTLGTLHTGVRCIIKNLEELHHAECLALYNHAYSNLVLLQDHFERTAQVSPDLEAVQQRLAIARDAENGPILHACLRTTQLDILRQGFHFDAYNTDLRGLLQTQGSARQESPHFTVQVGEESSFGLGRRQKRIYLRSKLADLLRS